MPHACGAPFGASSTRAKKARLKGGHLIKEGRQLSLFIFAQVLAEINVLNLGIAKMVLKKPTCGRYCNDFVCFGVVPPCVANKLIAKDSQPVPLRRNRNEAGKKE